MPFSLHPTLKRDTHRIARLSLCDALLMDNALYPWVILVPRVEGASEIIDLSETDQRRLLEETAHVSDAMKRLFSPDKLNIAALGNQVPQLHMHIIARFRHDPAWPNPVWGKGSVRYIAELREERLARLSLALRRASA